MILRWACRSPARNEKEKMPARPTIHSAFNTDVGADSFRNPNNEPLRQTTVYEDATTHDLEVLVLGTSNSIGPASCAGKIGQKLGVKLTNLLVGACSSTLGVYQLQKVQPVRRGVAFIDFAINDSHTGWNIGGAPPEAAANGLAFPHQAPREGAGSDLALRGAPGL
jgi:hypothetical protein